jgi:hypothetical protein
MLYEFSMKYENLVAKPLNRGSVIGIAGQAVFVFCAAESNKLG